MLINEKYEFYLVFCVFFAAKDAFSAEILKLCDNCVSYSDFERTAASGSTLSNDIVKVVNPRTGDIRKFKVTFEKEPGIGVIIYKEPMPVSANEYESAQQAMYGLNQILDFFDSHKNVPSAYSNSAVDIIGFSQKINQISTYYNQTITSGQVWNLYWGSILSLGGTLTGLNIVADFYFSDGSKAIMRLSALNTPSSGQVFIFDLLEVWDNQGNKVPINKSEFDRRAGDIYHAVTAEAMSKLLNVAGRHDVFTLQFSRESFGGGGGVRITDCNSASSCKIKEN